MIDEINIEHVSFQYDSKTVLNDINLIAKKGQITAIIGPNGAGKTTLFKIIDLLLKPTSGKIMAGNQDILTFSMRETLAWRKSISYIMQEPYLFNYSIKNNIEYPLRIRLMHGPEVTKRVSEQMSRFHLEEFAKKKPHQLSSGERKKVAIAQALITEPAMIILDEPTASIDPEVSLFIEQYLQSLRSSNKMIILISTHDLFQAKRLADSVTLLYKGTVIEHGDKKAIFESPKNEITRKFVNGDIIVDR